MTEGASAPAYTAPPIIEAVVQLLFVEPLSNGVYRKLIKKMKRSYANHLDIQNINAKIDFPKRSATFDEQPQTKLSSDDEADIFIIQRNALTWSRLAPYQGWAHLISRVRADLEDAHGTTGHRKLGRIGVRYINRIDVPQENDVVRYEDYLAININLPSYLSVIDNYAWRFERDFPGQSLRAIVQSAIVEPEIPDCGAFLLDIDIVALSDLPAKLDHISSKLEEMRALKNDIFEVSITDRARARFSS